MKAKTVWRTAALISLVALWVALFFTDATGDTFTVLVVFPDGSACVAASGTGWEILPPPAPGQEG